MTYLTFRVKDHLSRKPLCNFDICQGNIRDFTKSQGSFREKILSCKSGQKLFIVSSIFTSVWVFSSIQLVLYVNYAFIIMKSLCHILIIDNNTSTSMVWEPLNIGRSATNRQGISQCLQSGHPGHYFRIVVLCGLCCFDCHITVWNT